MEKVTKVNRLELSITTLYNVALVVGDLRGGTGGMVHLDLQQLYRILTTFNSRKNSSRTSGNRLLLTLLTTKQQTKTTVKRLEGLKINQLLPVETSSSAIKTMLLRDTTGSRERKIPTLS